MIKKKIIYLDVAIGFAGNECDINRKEFVGVARHRELEAACRVALVNRRDAPYETVFVFFISVVAVAHFYYWRGHVRSNIKKKF